MTWLATDVRRIITPCVGAGSRLDHGYPAPGAVAAFADDLSGHGGDPQRISDTSSDMSQAFMAGIGAHVKLVETHWDGRSSAGTRQPQQQWTARGHELPHPGGPRPPGTGYRSTTKMITIIYLIAGKLPNPSPYVAHPI